MRRLRALTALALAALAGHAGAAEISRVATSGEPGNPIDIDLGVRWDRSVERATITREGQDGKLRYARTRNAIVPRVAVGLWNDLEAHFELPYVLGDDRELRYGTVWGLRSDFARWVDPVATDVDVNGQPCPGCSIFSVDEAVAYHGGRAGDLKAGLSWGIFNERKDDTKPFWLVGMDLTFPTAARWEPGKNRTADTWLSPLRDETRPGPFGEKIWKWDIYTVLSKRYAYVDPYVKAHARLAFRSSSTYSNCDAVTEATAPTLTTPQMNGGAAASCASWGSAAGAKLPFVAGLTFGSEIIPYEDVKENQKLSIDLRVFSELTSRQRFYNELSDATGKLLMTEGYMEVGALLGLYLRASQYVQLQARASLATRTSHYLTGESLGKDGAWPEFGAGGVTLDPGAMNPNYDWRHDAPGRRFRLSEASVFELSFGGVLQF